MPVEKISVSQPVQSAPVIEKQTEYYDKPKTSGSGKDVVATLSALAAVGAAGVAVYKHNEAKKLIAEAEKAAKKQVEEANAKLKKAEVEVEKKIKEAVDKVKEEYEKKTEKTDNLKTKVDSARSYLSKLAEKVRNKFKKDTPKTEKTKEPDKSVKKAKKEKPAPVKEPEAEKVSLKKRISENIGETAYVVYSKGISYVKKFKRIMKTKLKNDAEQEIKPVIKPEVTSEPKPAAVTEIKPEVIDVEGKAEDINEKISLKTRALTLIHKTSDYVSEKFSEFKNVFARKIAVKKNVKPKEITKEAIEVAEPLEKPVIILKPTVANGVEKFFDEDANKGIKEIENDDFAEKLKKIMSESANKKWLKAQHDIKEQEYQELFDAYFAQKVKNDIRKQLNRKVDYKAVIDSSINEPNSEIKHNIQQAEYDELGDLLTRNAFKAIKLPEVKDISEQNLIIEYNALKNVVKNLPAMNPASKRFLEIQGELINHRGYYITDNGTLVKKPAKEVKSEAVMKVEDFFGKDAEKGLKELEKAEFAKKQQEIASQTANENWLNEQHDMKKKEYQKLFDEYFVQKEREQFAEDAAKGLRQLELQQDGERYAKLVSDAKNENWLKEQHDIREQEYQKLFDEHFAKQEKEKFFDEGADKGVKILEGENYAAQEAKLASDIRNQAYLDQQHDIKEQEYRQLFDEHFKEEQGRKVVTDLEKKLNGKGNLVPETPRKHNRRYHDKLQKEYDKLAIEPETQQNVKRKAEQFIDDANRYSGIRTDGIDYAPASQKQLSVAPDATYKDSDCGEEVIRNVVRGLNDLPASFNETERLLIQRAYRHTNVPQENVTEYPKLYAGKQERKAAIKGLFSEGFPSLKKLKEFFGIMGEERAAKKAYKKAKAEHIARRTRTYRAQGGVGGAENAITNPYMVTRDMKFSHKKYASMSKERPTEKDWEVEMTRAEFMKDKEKYMLENFEQEYQTQK